MKALLLSALLLLPVAWAQPVSAQSESAVVEDAARRLMRRGVRFAVRECSPGIAGLYRSSERLLTICHAAIRRGLTVETIAHEAVHVAQDCAYGSLGDSLSGPIYWRLREADPSTAAGFLEVITSSLVSRDKSSHVLASSRNLRAAGGASEIEAYGIEHSINGALSLVETLCPLR